jgi:hypothetical protein
MRQSTRHSERERRMPFVIIAETQEAMTGRAGLVFVSAAVAACASFGHGVAGQTSARATQVHAHAVGVQSRRRAVTPARSPAAKTDAAGRVEEAWGRS